VGTQAVSQFAAVILSPGRGDAVPGSTLYRNRCCQCGEPIRVQLRDRLSTRVECDACRRLGRRPALARSRPAGRSR
jgi:hypothetical protein